MSGPHKNKVLHCMFRALFSHRVRAHAQHLLDTVFPQGYQGELFLCGGAFKPVFCKKGEIHDLDLWVRDPEERNKLCDALCSAGGSLVEDFFPFCQKFRREGRWVKVAYQDVEDGSLQDVLESFDLSLCGIGARYVNGEVVETHVHEECWQAFRHRSVRLLRSYINELDAEKTPTLLRSLHRMGLQATELGYCVDGDDEHRLWQLYWDRYTPEERRAAMDLYFESMVVARGQRDDHLVRRASEGYVPVLHKAACGAALQAVDDRMHRRTAA